MKLPRLFSRKKEPVTRYKLADHEAIVKHTERTFGNFVGVLQDTNARGIQVDLLVIPPNSSCDYYTIVTHGMGALPMRLTDDAPTDLPTMAELVIRLPRHWDVKNAAPQFRWPFAMLHTLAHIPLDLDTWLAPGNVFDLGDACTPFTAAMLLDAPSRQGNDATLTLADGRKVAFYYVLPLYQDELEWISKHNPVAFFDETQDRYYGTQDPFSPVNPERPSMLESDLIDTDESHADTIEEKQLPVESLTACSHIAIYLRWMIEHNLTSAAFNSEHDDLVSAICASKYASDLRIYMAHKLNSCLLQRYFSREGQAFTAAYYRFGEELTDTYPANVDQHALEHFGEEKYNSAEFQDEAYLFIPWNEAYYAAMAVKISAAYQRWKGC